MSRHNLFLCLIPLLYSGLVESCSLGCGDNTRVCLNNVEGYLGADCSGLSDEIVCASESDPCMNQCLHTSPVLSKDGKACQMCYVDETSGEKKCPKCKEGEMWCRAEKLCKSKTQPCDGQCPLYLYPVLNGTTCEQCPLRDIYLDNEIEEEYDFYYYDYGGVKSTRWCKQSNRCYDPPTEPCNQKCYNWDKWYCASTDSCIANTTPCNKKCDSNHFYCAENNKCVSQYDACGETCFGDRRYCSVTKSCLDQETPCGSKCPKGTNFCALHEQCQENGEHCPCPNDRWGCTTTRLSGLDDNEVYNNSCHLKYNETLKKQDKKIKAGEICVKNTYGQYLLNTPSSIRYLGLGECFPGYKQCRGTDACYPRHADEATMCENAVTTPAPTPEPTAIPSNTTEELPF